MKNCPFCAEEIQDAAIKCKHCGEFLEGGQPPALPRKKGPWYFRTSFMVIAFCSVGPLALPLLWWHPKMSRVWKVLLSIGILLLSWVMFQTTLKSAEAIKEYYQLIEDL